MSDRHHPSGVSSPLTSLGPLSAPNPHLSDEVTVGHSSGAAGCIFSHR